MVAVGRPLIFPKMALMMYRAMLCRWVHGVQWGPGELPHVKEENA
jgi:hypothetical protein